MKSLKLNRAISFPGRIISLVALAGSHLASVGHTANLVSDWTGSASSIWEDAGNWSTPDYPNDGAHNYRAVVTHGAGALEITTGGPINIRGLTLNQSGSGSTTLKLGGDFSLTSHNAISGGSGIYNTTGRIDAVVLDLNGFTFSTLGLASTYHNFGDGNYTLKSSAPSGGGTFIIRAFNTNAKVDVQDNVTVRSFVEMPTDLSATTWSAGSTLQVAIAAGGNQAANAKAPMNLGNLIIGDASDTGATTFSLNHSNITVRGDVTINSFAGATGGAGSRLSFTSASATLRVGGGFTDLGSDTLYYAANAANKGNIAFVGGRATERSVNIHRMHLQNHFQIGDAGAAGNIGLEHDLSTTASVTVKDGSRLNVNQYTVSSESFQAMEDATLAFGIHGLISADGLLTLGSFHLELVGDWSDWAAGNDLLLFEYGSLSGTPLLSSIAGPSGLTYGGLRVDDGQIYLTNVAIPEPNVALLVGLSGLMLGGILLPKKQKQCSLISKGG